MRPLADHKNSKIPTLCASLAIFGVIHGSPALIAEPLKGEGSFSLYYVAEVAPTESGGISGKVETVEGKWETYRLSVADTKKANMEGSVSVKGPDGKPVLVSITKIGVWSDLPKGWEGKGNRVNPLVAYRSVAADQKIHPYGSRVFVPDIAGFKTPDGLVHDGYFWVADVGGGIKGTRRFDIFVGAKPNYTALMAHGPGKWKTPVEVENLPKAPAEFSPRTDTGVKRILEGVGYDIGAQVPGKSVDERKGEPLSQKDCLTDFQKQHPQIPEAEYGSRRGAVTLWFLTQAATSLKKGEKYPVTPFAK